MRGCRLYNIYSRFQLLSLLRIDIHPLFPSSRVFFKDVELLPHLAVCPHPEQVLAVSGSEDPVVLEGLCAPLAAAFIIRCAVVDVRSHPPTWVTVQATVALLAVVVDVLAQLFHDKGLLAVC